MLLIEKLFLEDTDEEVSDVYRDQNGKFYTFDGTNYKQVPSSIQRSLAKKYHEYKRMLNATQAGKDIEALKAAHDQRLKLKSTIDIDTAEKEQRKNINALMHKHAEEEAEARKRRKEREEQLPVIANREDTDSTFNELLNSLHDFVQNQVYDEEEVNIEYSYDEPDPYETIDPDIFSKGRTYKHNDNDEEPQEKQRPLVLFYFDRSYSFDPIRAPQKTELGKRLLNLFKNQKDIDVDTVYFSKICIAESENSNAEKAALKAGGNITQVLLDDIRERTKNRLTNIVILTDSDNGSGTPVYINGSIWIIFAGSWNRGFAESIKKATPETKKKIFYFEGVVH